MSDHYRDCYWDSEGRSQSRVPEQAAADTAVIAGGVTIRVDLTVSVTVDRDKWADVNGVEPYEVVDDFRRYLDVGTLADHLRDSMGLLDEADGDVQVSNPVTTVAFWAPGDPLYRRPNPDDGVVRGMVEIRDDRPRCEPGWCWCQDPPGAHSVVGAYRWTPAAAQQVRDEQEPDAAVVGVRGSMRYAPDIARS